MKFLIPALLLVVTLCLAISVNSKDAGANHNIYLPIVPNTPLMQQVIRNQGYNWCADARASAYPGFITQLKDVNDRYMERTGIRSVQVGFSDTACQVKHVMPDGLSCTGWAAQIFYANWPVTIQYCWTLGYTDWRSAHGHELGHGILGLHEQYNDSSGAIGCTRRTDTVMDCGSGVRYPTSRDVTYGCAIIRTAWCGSDGTVAPPPPLECQAIGWDPCGGVWRFADGWAFHPLTQEWINPHGWPEWTPCNSDGLRWNYHSQAWFIPGSSFYSRGFWSSTGGC